MLPHYKKLPDGVDLTSSAPGKVILHGEHSVVYGKLAIAASLELRTKIHLSEIDSPDAVIVRILPLDFEHCFDLRLIKQLMEHPVKDHERHLDKVREFVNLTSSAVFLEPKVLKSCTCLFYLLTSILVDVKPIVITIDTELSMGAGTGSSASYSVALAALFLSYLKQKNPTSISSSQEQTLISDWAFRAEKIFHSIPSGIDNTICTHGSLIQFKKDHPLEHLTLNSPVELLLINTKVPRETSNLIRHVAKLKSTFPQLVDNILESIDHLTITASETIRNMDTSVDTKVKEEGYQHWQTLVQMNHSLLSALGVSHARLDEVNLILDQHGLKGKLTGAGGGGFAIAIVPPDYDPEEVIRILKEKDFEVIFTKLGGGGVKVY